jgi:hypothetical protein
MAAAPIRPPVWPPAQTNIQPGRNDARLAAQKAFFEAALAGAPKPKASAASPVSDEPSPRAAPAQAARSVAAAAASAADRLPPPGSIVNILV